MTIIVAICASGFALGVVGLAFALGGNRFDTDPNSDRSGRASNVGTSAVPGRNAGTSRSNALSGRRELGLRLRIGLSLVGAILVVAATRWPVAGLLAAAVIFALPRILASTSPRDAIRLTEAVAVWTELLRDTLTASAGLAQAIVATSGIAPDEIHEPVTRLGDRIVSGVPLDDALQMFGSELGEPSAEQVVSALRLAVTSRAQRLVDLLGALADSTREEVAMRLRVEARRASARSGVRTVIWFSLGFVALLTLVAHSYLAPFGSVTGQLVLVFVGACYATGLFLMVRLVRPAPAGVFPRKAASA
jgi:Flp pilus assembly protein TadB